MGKIRVEFKGAFKKITNEASTEVDLNDNKTLQDVIEKLKDRFGSEFAESTKFRDYLIICINGIDCRKYEDLNTKLREGDRLSIGHIVAGG